MFPPAPDHPGVGLSYSDGMEEAFFREVPAYLKQFIAEFGERRNDGEEQIWLFGLNVKEYKEEPFPLWRKWLKSIDESCIKQRLANESNGWYYNNVAREREIPGARFSRCCGLFGR